MLGQLQQPLQRPSQRPLSQPEPPSQQLLSQPGGAWPRPPELLVTVGRARGAASPPTRPEGGDAPLPRLGGAGAPPLAWQLPGARPPRWPPVSSEAGPWRSGPP